MRITNLKPLISEEAIQTRVKEMAGEISTLYKDEPLVVVCVLKGAFMFFSDLVRHLTCKPELDFVRLASYGSAAQRSKTITFTKDVEIPLEGKHVLIVEDIVDTGHSMDFHVLGERDRLGTLRRAAVAGEAQKSSSGLQVRCRTRSEKNMNAPLSTHTTTRGSSL